MGAALLGRSGYQASDGSDTNGPSLSVLDVGREDQCEPDRPE